MADGGDIQPVGALVENWPWPVAPKGCQNCGQPCATRRSWCSHKCRQELASRARMGEFLAKRLPKGFDDAQAFPRISRDAMLRTRKAFGDGHFKDDTEKLEKAIAYLKRHAQ